MNKQLKAAKAEVNKHKFGTPAWEAAMTVVRQLVDAENATQKFIHTSIDGDVWSV